MQSSIESTGIRKEYSDHLKQVWEDGQYLRGLPEIFRPMFAAIIKTVHAEMGIIKTPTSCTFPAEDIGQTKYMVTALMARYGDPDSGLKVEGRGAPA